MTRENRVQSPDVEAACAAYERLAKEEAELRGSWLQASQQTAAASEELWSAFEQERRAWDVYQDAGGAVAAAFVDGAAADREAWLSASRNAVAVSQRWRSVYGRERSAWDAYWAASRRTDEAFAQMRAARALSGSEPASGSAV